MGCCCGGLKAKLPPFDVRDRDILYSYNLEEMHFRKMWNVFHEVDIDRNGFWTNNEVYRLIREPRISMRAPIINAIYFFADGNSDGCLTFQDFMVAFCSFCALSKEEVFQFFFMIVDEDRNGKIDKEELNTFFSYVPPEAGADQTPMFPVNNKNALDKFRGGRWSFLEFEGIAQLCERFPYISYPVLHVQHLFRSKLLGLKFWEKFSQDRMKINLKERTFVVRLPDGSQKKMERPGRCTMKEILEYSRRKTTVQNGRRVGKPVKTDQQISSSEVTKLRDEQISRMPLMNMIRNSRCMYYVPWKPPEDLRSMVTKNRLGEEKRPELELQGFDETRPFSADESTVHSNAALPWDGEEDEDGSEWETDTDVSDEGVTETTALAMPNSLNNALALPNPLNR
mmetsp:Transcript_113048/g.178598  ORF Transcript_113048/g.178598 Transcript_113048/m.178598 type:complete len:397 (+) Transcript_113048:76-1266(+)